MNAHLWNEDGLATDHFWGKRRAFSFLFPQKWSVAVCCLATHTKCELTKSWQRQTLIVFVLLTLYWNTLSWEKVSHVFNVTNTKLCLHVCLCCLNRTSFLSSTLHMFFLSWTKWICDEWGWYWVRSCLTLDSGFIYLTLCFSTLWFVWNLLWCSTVMLSHSAALRWTVSINHFEAL